MSIDRRLPVAFAAALLVVASLACEKSPDDADNSQTSAENSSGEESETTEQAPEAEITLEPKGDEMAYAREKLSVQAGERVKLTLRNTASESSMKHNVVLVDTADVQEARSVAETGWKNVAGGFAAKHDLVIAQTDTAEPGGSSEVVFTAPSETGEYLYICTYPGHFPKMKGKLVVE